MEHRGTIVRRHDLGTIADEQNDRPACGEELEWFIRRIQEENLLHILNLPS
jgi:hypothetical protein